MPYVPHTEDDIARILKTIGIASVEGLFSVFPEELRIKQGLNLPLGLSEQEVKGLLKGISNRNRGVADNISFLGAGAYNHYIPSIVDSLISRSEFYTSYTPYQPEVSQGTLQAIFEYQSLVAGMTGMDASNASLYDGASATAEAVLMAGRITGRKGVLISSALNPLYRKTVDTYLKGSPDRVSDVMYCTEAGVTLPDAVDKRIDDDTACVVVQQPNFFGAIEDIEAISGVVHKKKALLIVVATEPVSMGLIKPPGEAGCDIAVGENQSFGNALNFGGPYLGFMATKTGFLRQMPGRLVGETVDKNGKRAFCLTLATREQHIRRERATSNICTNHGLSALAALVHMLALGKNGLKDLAVLNASKAQFLKTSLLGINGVSLAFSSPFFNEFVVKIPCEPEGLLKKMLKHKILGGLALRRFYPELKNHILVCATEMNSRQDIEGFKEALGAILD